MLILCQQCRRVGEADSQICLSGLEACAAASQTPCRAVGLGSWHLSLLLEIVGWPWHLCWLGLAVEEAVGASERHGV